MTAPLPQMRPAWRPPGLSAPWHTATTAHLACLYPWHQGLDLGPRGVLLGRDAFTGAAFFFDPFDLYSRRLVSNPNMLILGDLGRGKSTTVKCLIHRLVGGLRDRWVAILDPKREYGPLAEALGLQLIRLQPGGKTRLNPLDAGPAADRLGPDELLARRIGLLIALLGSVIGRDLTPLEDAACGWAADELTSGSATKPSPTLRDVHHLLGHPTGSMATRAQIDASTLAQRLGDLRLAAEALLERDLRGMFDGASTVRTDLGGRGLVVDLSAVFGNPRLLTPVMVCVTGWLQAVMARPVGEASATRRLQVIDEAWALLANERTARYLQASWRLSRQWGVANIAITHTVEDLMAQADDGTAVVKVARGLVQTTDTIVHHYAKRCGDEAAGLLGLSPSEAAAIPTLRLGQALWRVAGRSTIVSFRVARGEEHLTDTDQAMEGR